MPYCLNALNMSNALINFYHNLKEPIIIYDKRSDILYHNISFEKMFGNFNNSYGLDCLNKLTYKFLYHHQICILKTEDIRTYNPIINALKNNSNYTNYVIYQKEEDKFYHFMIKAFSANSRYRIVYFYDITQDLQNERLKEENQKLRAQNIEFANITPKAQNQAVRMSLLNRISLSLKNELDIKALIEKSLKELSGVLGANKSYFAEFKDNDKNEFLIKYTYPEIYAPQIGEKVIYNEDLIDELHKGNNSILPCLKEHEGASIPLLNPSTRIIIPILKNLKIYGIIVLFTPKREIQEIEKELLVGISLVVTSAIVQASLFHQISQKKEELEDTIKELKETQLQLINSEKMASLGQLIASVAHEINTPLGAINANNEMMEMLFNKISIDNDKLSMLNEMNNVDKEAIKRIKNLVQSLQRFVRLDEATAQEAIINQELDLTLDLIHHKIKRGFEIIKEYNELPHINCYPNMLNQVFLNILMNAIHSIEDIKKENPNYIGRIKIKTSLEESYLKISILDNGKGIEEKNKNKIFNAGFTTKKKGQGTGLGLAICEKIIEKHKGKISFKSGSNEIEPDYKTEFIILIPS